MLLRHDSNASSINRRFECPLLNRCEGLLSNFYGYTWLPSNNQGQNLFGQKIHIRGCAKEIFDTIRSVNNSNCSTFVILLNESVHFMWPVPPARLYYIKQTGHEIMFKGVATPRISKTRSTILASWLWRFLECISNIANWLFSAAPSITTRSQQLAPCL